MVAGLDFKIFVTNEGKLYSIGKNDRGMLGLGKSVVDTNGKAI